MAVSPIRCRQEAFWMQTGRICFSAFRESRWEFPYLAIHHRSATTICFRFRNYALDAQGSRYGVWPI